MQIHLLSNHLFGIQGLIHFAIQVLARFEQAKQIEIKGDATIHQLAQLALEIEAEEQMVCGRQLMWHSASVAEQSGLVRMIITLLACKGQLRHFLCSLQSDTESIEEVAGLIQTLLLEKAPMLQACFGICINELPQICTLPQLIEGYVPDLDQLPQLILGLARDVDWDSEQECFDGVAKVFVLTP